MTDLTYISYGAGVQSTALLVCSALGLHDVPKADVAIFADTGDEPQYVYDYLQLMTTWAADHGIPVRVTSKGRLSEWVIDRQQQGKRFVSIPLYTANVGDREGMLRRQCTREFKVEPITQEVRRILGVEPGRRVRGKVVAMMGISIDEALRMKPSRTPWITNRYPLVDANLDRRACERIVVAAGLPRPQKSACIYCPYHADTYWLQMKTERPAEFAKAVAFDHAIRDMTMRGRTQQGYVHRSCQPLDEVDFDPMRDQHDLFTNECEGMCGV